jgi:prepilin-type N-terminal cleavage/methylation domain-containing protein/prepilin-type processing-associated H-X9-DG protein
MLSCSNRYVRKSSGQGFSLIELLVAMAVVGLLVAIGASAHARVQMLANQTQCASNMRQIGVALRMYANANGGMLPGTAHTNRSDSWIYDLREFLDDVDAVRISPADPAAQRRLKSPDATSYVANDLVFFTQSFDNRGRPIASKPGQGSLHALENPSETFVTFVGSERRGDDVSNDHTHANGWGGNWGAFVGDVTPDIFRTGSRSADRTRGKSNYLFADGRVETIAASKVHGWITSGVNIAKPPEKR